MAANNEGTPNVTFRRLRKRFAKLTGLHRVFSGPAAPVPQLRDSDKAIMEMQTSFTSQNQTWDPSRNVDDLAARAQEIGAQVRLQEERDQRTPTLEFSGHGSRDLAGTADEFTRARDRRRESSTLTTAKL